MNWKIKCWKINKKANDAINRKANYRSQNWASKCRKIWVAVGLLNKAGLDLILKSIPANCRINFIVGINLPSDPKALLKLLKHCIESRGEAKISTDKFFIQSVRYWTKGRLTAFVGSANATNGGYVENREMSIQTNDRKICIELIKWFEKELIPNSENITLEFIKVYKPKYDKRMLRQRQDESDLLKIKQKVKEGQQAEMKNAKSLISKLKIYRKSKKYLEHKEYRKMILRV